MKREHVTRWTLLAGMTGTLAIVVASPIRVEAIGFCSHAVSTASHRTPQPRHQLVHTRQYNADGTPDAAPRGAALLPHERRNDGGGTRSKHSSSAAVERMPTIAPSGRRVRTAALDTAVLALPDAVFHDAHAPPCRRSSSAGALS